MVKQKQGSVIKAKARTGLRVRPSVMVRRQFSTALKGLRSVFTDHGQPIKALVQDPASQAQAF